MQDHPTPIKQVKWCEFAGCPASECVHCQGVAAAQAKRPMRERPVRAWLAA